MKSREYSNNYNEPSTPFHILCSIDLDLHRIEPSILLQYSIKVKVTLNFIFSEVFVHTLKGKIWMAKIRKQKKDNRLSSHIIMI